MESNTGKYLVRSFFAKDLQQRNLGIEDIKRLLRQQGESLSEEMDLLGAKMQIVASSLQTIIEEAILHTDEMTSIRINQKGFLKRIELLGCLRFHFFESLDDESYPHDHKQLFVTKVLAGGYDHTVYQKAQEGSSSKVYIKKSSGFVDTGRTITIEKDRTDRIRPESGYVIAPRVLHSLSKLKAGTTTLVVRSTNPTFENKDPMFLIAEEPKETMEDKMTIEETQNLLRDLKARLFPVDMSL